LPPPAFFAAGVFFAAGFFFAPSGFFFEEATAAVVSEAGVEAEAEAAGSVGASSAAGSVAAAAAAGTVAGLAATAPSEAVVSLPALLTSLAPPVRSTEADFAAGDATEDSTATGAAAGDAAAAFGGDAVILRPVALEGAPVAFEGPPLLGPVGVEDAGARAKKDIMFALPLVALLPALTTLLAFAPDLTDFAPPDLAAAGEGVVIACV
jgi:hypothetical protein